MLFLSQLLYYVHRRNFLFMKTIQLTGKRGGATLVDDSDYAWLNQWKWKHAMDGYAKRNFTCSGVQKTIKMQHLILFGPALIESIESHNKIKADFKGKMVDHQNRNRLDNQRENLRVTTPLYNALNSKINNKNTSGYKGVSLDRRKWRAAFRVYKTCNNICGFLTAEDAARAYNAMCFEQYHDYSILNSIPGFSPEESIIMPPIPETQPHIKKEFEANIEYKGTVYYLGVFKTAIQAAQAYCSKCEELGLTYKKAYAEKMKLINPDWQGTGIKKKHYGVQIHHKGTRYYVGCFSSEVEAAIAYNKKCDELGAADHPAHKEKYEANSNLILNKGKVCSGERRKACSGLLPNKVQEETTNLDSILS
jgi:hypothetical protein